MDDPGWFWLYNELLDVYLPLIGEYAFILYMALARKTNGRESVVQVSYRDLAKFLNTSRSSVQRAMQVIIAAGLVVMEPPSKREEAPIYTLTNVPKLAAALDDQFKENLRAMRDALKTRPKKVVSPYGDTQPLLKYPSKSSEYPVENHHISTETPGTGVSPLTGTGVSPLYGDSSTLYIKNLIKTERNGGELPPPEANSRGLAGKRALFDAAKLELRRSLPPGCEEDWRWFEGLTLISVSEEAVGAKVTQMWLSIAAPFPHESRQAAAEYEFLWQKALRRFFHFNPRIHWSGIGDGDDNA